MHNWKIGRRAGLASLASLLVRPALARLTQVHPLQGHTVDLAILGAADGPSTLVREMAPAFADFAREQHGYEVTVRYTEAPRDGRYSTVTEALAAQPSKFNLMIVDGRWLGAFAAAKTIMPLNPTIDANKALQVEWYSPRVSAAFQLYPDGSRNCWGLPQSADVLALFVRHDWLTAAGEQEAFKTRFGIELPQNWDDFEKLTWDDYAKVLQFFDRPADGRRAFASFTSAESDDISCPVLSFLFGHGGQAWDGKTGQVVGVLNTAANARALEHYVSLLKLQPEAPADKTPADVTALFSQGRVFSALQWTGAGAAMIPDALGDQVLVVPPPSFDGARSYVIGGQSWVVCDHADDTQAMVAVDFLAWWYRPETALEFATRGGLPCDRETLSQPSFEALRPWLRTYKYMLPRSSDLLHDPRFVDLLAVQQSGFERFASGKTTDAKLALDLIACRQQAILFDAGSAERRPDDTCLALQR